MVNVPNTCKQGPESVCVGKEGFVAIQSVKEVSLPEFVPIMNIGSVLQLHCAFAFCGVKNVKKRTKIAAILRQYGCFIRKYIVLE